jgi:hypothetical protein
MRDVNHATFRGHERSLDVSRTNIDPDQTPRTGAASCRHALIMHLLMGMIRSRWYCPTCARSIDDTDTLELRRL